ncbi:MAG: porin family protein [Cytophagaceae bacterium]
MKFYLIAVLTAIFMVSSASAQDTHLGFKGGLNIYDVHSTNNYNFDSKIGFHAGVLAHIHLSEKFALQPEIMYSGQGGKYQNSNARLNLDYINVPVLLQYMFNNGFRLHAGPQVGFLMKANSINNHMSANHTNDFNMLDFSLSVGASYVHTKSGLGIDARYNHGLSQINEHGSAKLTNRGFQLGLFYLFGHKS